MINDKEKIEIMSDIINKNIFKVPDNYFDELSVNIQDKVSAIQNKKSVFHSIFFNKPLIYRIAYSFIFLSFIFLTFYFLNLNKKNQTAEAIYWDEVLKDNIFIDNIEENQIIDIYLTQMIKESDNIQNQNSKLTEDYIDYQYNNDVFNEL